MENVYVAPPVVTTVPSKDVAAWMHLAAHGYIDTASALLPIESVRSLVRAFAEPSPSMTVHAAAAVWEVHPPVRVRMMLWLRDMMMDASAAHLAAQYAVAFWAAQNGAVTIDASSSVAVATVPPADARELTHEEIGAASTLCAMRKGHHDIDLSAEACCCA